jgi:hypothetical protein
MAKLRFAIFAERVSVDRYSNRLDILNVFEQIGIPELPAAVWERSKKEKKLPALPISMVLVAHWRRSDPQRPESTLRTRAELLSPRGQVLGTAEQDISLREHAYTRGLFGYQGLPLAGPGTYTARISLRSGGRWRKSGEASFEVTYLSKAAMAAAVRPRRLL